MSAFIVSDLHIATIVRNYAKLAPGTDLQVLADTLLAENIRSVNYRYEENTPIETCNISIYWDDASWDQVLSLCDCLAYQSCEHPEWEGSAARTLLNDIIRAIEQEAGPARGELTWSI